MTTIVLTASEITQGAMVGVMRHARNVCDARKIDQHAHPGDYWQTHIEGALGEMALAKYLNRYWAGTGTVCAPDVGIDDVRTTRHDNGRLILHPDDPDDRRFWLLTGLNGRYTVRGHIMGGEGKHKRYWCDPKGGRAAYFVPQDALTT